MIVDIEKAVAAHESHYGHAQQEIRELYIKLMQVKALLDPPDA